MRLLFDIETNGLLDTVTQVHCIVATDIDSDKEWVFRPSEVKQGMELLSSAEMLLGHNIAGYDLPVLNMLHGFKRPPRLKMLDTLPWSRASYPQMKVSDIVTSQRRKASGQALPGNLFGRHSLEAWGYRLGRHKGSFDHSKATGFSEDMLSYCRNDVQLNKLLFWHLAKRGAMPLEAALWETEFAWIIARQERHGVRFDVDAAGKLYSELTGIRNELLEDARKVFAPWYVPDGSSNPNAKTCATVTPKRDNKKKGVTKGDPYTKIRLEEFNPGSTDHIADRLMKLRGWKPEEFTDGGKPQVTDEILAALPYPECKPLARYLMVAKRLGALGDGKKAWLKLEKNGRLYGRCETVGTRTQRCAHRDPNVAQVPSSKSEYGPECRALFVADDGWALVGADAAGCQLRMLAHYLHPFDGGRFAKQVVEGDPHTYLLATSGAHCPEHDKATAAQRLACTAAEGKNLCREYQKTVTYAYLFGAFGKRIGVHILGRTEAYGTFVKANMARALSGGGKGFEKALDAAFERKYVTLPDGRRAPTNSRHDTLNTLLMGAEAVVMKRALVLADWKLQDDGLVPCEENVGERGDYEFVLNIHDEVQATCEKHLTAKVGTTLVWGIEEAGRMFNLNLPLKGDHKIGRTWKETH